MAKKVTNKVEAGLGIALSVAGFVVALFLWRHANQPLSLP